MPLLQHIDKFDLAIRLLLYNCLFWLPYSPAVIEVSVILAGIVWLIKHSVHCMQEYRGTRSLPASLRQGFSSAQSSVDKPVAVFLASCLVSAVLSPYPGLAWGGFWTKTFEWVVIFYLVRETMVTMPQVVMAVIIILFTSSATILDGIQQYYWTGFDIFYGHQMTRGGITAGFKHANSLAAYLVVTLPLMLVMPFFSALKKRQRYIILALIVCAGWALYLTFSRMAWIAFGVSFLLSAAVLYRRSAKIVAIIAFLLMGIALLNFGLHGKGKSRLDPGSISQAVEWRKHIWTESLELIKERPLWGHGISTYMTAFEAKRSRDVYYPPDPTYAHNCYIQMLVETGFLGTISFLWIMGVLGTAVVKVMGQAGPVKSDASLLLLGLSAGWVGFLVHSFFDTHFYSLQLSTVFWFVTGLVFSALRLLKPVSIYGIKNKLNMGEKFNG